MSENIPHSLGGFRGSFESEHGRKPTEQEIWNAAICSWRDLTQQKLDVAKKREEVIANLLMYAGDNGYGHIDYADTMRHAAALLQSTALPVPTKEARWVRISEDGEGQENYCEECGAESGISCTDVEGREWGRRVHAIRQEEPAALPVDAQERGTKSVVSRIQPEVTDKPKIGCVQHDCAECQARAAMPVGELTDEQILGAEKRAAIGATGRDDLTIRTARAILAAASSQPASEQASAQVVATETWFDGDRLITRYLTADDIYKPVSPQNNDPSR